MFKLYKLKKSVDDDNSVIIYSWDGIVSDRKIINIWNNIVDSYKKYPKLNLDDCLDILDIFYDEVLMYRSVVNKSLSVTQLFTDSTFRIYHIKHADGKVIKRVAILTARINNTINKGIIRPIVRFEYVDDSSALIKHEEIVNLSKNKASVLDDVSSR